MPGTTFTYDAVLIDKKEFNASWFVVENGRLDAPTAVACFDNIDSANDNANERNGRAESIGIRTRYDVRPLAHGEQRGKTKHVPGFLAQQ